MFRGAECQREAQGLGREHFWLREVCMSGVIITTCMETVCRVFILLAKQPPSWGIQLCPPVKGIFLLGLLTVYTSPWRAGEDHKISPHYPAAPFHLLHATLPACLPEVHAASGRG